MKKKLRTASTVSYGLLAALGLLLAFFSCSRDSSDLVTPPPAGDAKDILSFSFSIQGEDVKILEEDEDDVIGNIIRVILPADTDVTNLTPTIEIDGESVDPASGEAQDFTNPIDYTVTAEDGSTKTYTVEVTTRDNVKFITSFSINGVEGVIDEANLSILVELPPNTDVSALTPNITFEGKSVDPDSGEEVDFSGENGVTYTVTAQDDSTKAYNVKVEVLDEVEDDKDIVAFFFTIDDVQTDGVIDQEAQTIDVLLPVGTDINQNLAPTVDITGVSVDPASGAPVNFSNSADTPVIYTVTAADGTTKEYDVTVRVEVEDEGDTFVLTVRGTRFTIPTNPNISGYSYEVDSNGDGVFEGPFTGDATFDFATQGPRTLRIRGVFPAIQFGSVVGATQANKVISIDQWGAINWQSMEMAFKGCRNMEVLAQDIPILNNVSSMSSMFEGATKANPSVSDWDTSTVNDMSALFKDAVAFDPGSTLSTWGDKFRNAKNMSSMFEGATSFTGAGLSVWNVSEVENMSGMFRNATLANPAVGGWNVSAVTNMSSMFEGATEATPNVTAWTVSAVTNMSSMFKGAAKANPNVTAWNVSAVTNMSSMFEGATVANPNVTKWNVGSVQNMASMLKNSAFNREIHWLAINSNVDMTGMLDGSNMSAVSYSLALYVFEARNVSNVTLGAAGREFSNKSSSGFSHEGQSRSILESRGWTITGDSGNGSSGLERDVTNGVIRLRNAGII